MKDAKNAQQKKPSRERRRNPVGRDPRLERRREAALERALARASRSEKEQLSILDSRPGNSARERARLET
jgi:hypothetical protein